MKTTTRKQPKAKRSVHTASPACRERPARVGATKNTTERNTEHSTAQTADVRPPVRTSKRAAVLLLLQQKGGASADQIMAATGWQRHTVRGFLSVLGSKGGHKLVTASREDGVRTYSAK